MPPRRSLRTRTPSKHFDEVEITTPVTAPNSTSKPRSSGSKPQTVITPPHNESNGRITTRSKSKAQNDVDVHHEYEFYGPWGTSAMMLFFPCLLYYLYVCLYFFDGQLVGPGSMEKFRPWLRDIGNLIYKNAFPTWQASSLYLGFVSFQFLLAATLPGYMQEGLPISSQNNQRLMYNCNALLSFYVTVIAALSLNYFKILPLVILIDRFGELMTVAIVFSFVVAGLCYGLTVLGGKPYRMSGNWIYDYFMGAILNPRLGSVDIKMWAEVRIPWILLFLFSLAGCFKQLQLYNYVSLNQLFMVLATGLYINACAKGEQMIPQTWDMTYEKFGWLLSFWNFAGVPFTYCYSIIYMATHNPKIYKFPLPVYVALYTTLLCAYYIFDTSMSQKSAFKMQQAGNFKPRKAFPQLPGGVIENPKFLSTDKGKLLIDGWWAWSRKPNYAADFTQTLTWALCAGFGSPLPYWYPVFFFIMIVHRVGRDTARCSRKYGKYWEEYCRIVPYKFVPYVY